MIFRNCDFFNIKWPFWYQGTFSLWEFQTARRN